LTVNRRTRSPAVFVLVAAIIGIAVGFGVGYAYYQPKLAELERNKSSLEANLEKTLQDLESARERIGDLSKDVEVSKERMNSISAAMAKLDNDRMLLIELRKDLPETREDALSFWKNVKSIAVKSDPALGPSVDKIINWIDAYFDWADRAPPEDATDAQLGAWLLDLYRSGAMNYGAAIDDFENEAMLTVTTHIDLTLSVVEA